MINKTTKHGFTIIELIIVIVIIFILLGLFIPAVQATRELARSATCVSHMRQLGIALNSYYANHQMFPPSQLLTNRRYTNNHYSELLFLLPQMDQMPLYNSMNMNYAGVEWSKGPVVENRTVRLTTIESFLCPSDNHNPNLRNSYRFNRGRLNVTRPFFDGPFSIGVMPSQSSISDGLTRTAFVSERIGGTFQTNPQTSTRNVKVPAMDGQQFKSDNIFIPFCLAAGVENWENDSGKYWVFSDFIHTHYNHNGLPNDPRLTCNNPIARGDGFGFHPPRSYHNNGVNVLFGDGHVERVLSSINPAVWESLGTHAAGD